MTWSISETLLLKLTEFLAKSIGLYYTEGSRHNLVRGIVSAARDFGFEDPKTCMQWLMTSALTKNQVEILASHLTIGETYFFRDKRYFEILEEHIFPELISSRSKTNRCIRIWSAGCSSGEEPYSIAILLNKIITDLDNWHITILATDINPRFLAKASTGIYSEWSFRDVPPGIKEKNFNRVSNSSFEILPHIKKMVSFSYLNLAEDTYPALINNTNAMDLIFCRNVIMYFSPESQKRVVQRLSQCLVDGGRLFVSPSETFNVNHSGLTCVSYPGAIFYCKKDRKLPASEETFMANSLLDTQQDQLVMPVETYLKLVVEPEQITRIETEIATGFPLPPSIDEGIERAAELLNETDDPEAVAIKARVCANQGNFDEALNWCEKAIVGYKLNPCFHYLKATILLEKCDLDGALLSLNRVLYLDRNFVLAYFTLGNLMLKQGKTLAARKYFNELLKLLSLYNQDETLPESEGITAGRLAQIAAAIVITEEIV